MSDATATPSAGERPLLVRLRNWVGDVVLSLPALQALQAQGYSLTLVARGGWAPDLLRATPWRVHVQPKGLRERVAQWKSLRAELRAQDPGFDRRLNTVVLPQSFSSALEVRLAGLRAVGYRHEARGWLLARSSPLPHAGHVAQHYLAAAALLQSKALGAAAIPEPTTAQLPVSPAAREELAQVLARCGIAGPYVVICPFAGGKSANGGLDKRWPHFPEFARQAARTLGLPLLIYPAPNEVEQARTLYPDATLVPGSRLDVYAALLEAAALVVAIDTGPGHMAAAVGAPLLSLIGPTLPEHWRPLGSRVELVLGYPEWPGIDRVLERSRAVLAQAPPAAGAGRL